MNDRIYLTKEEQMFLTEMLEIKDTEQAVEKYADLMILEKVNPIDLQEYLKRTIKKYKERFAK